MYRNEKYMYKIFKTRKYPTDLLPVQALFKNFINSLSMIEYKLNRERNCTQNRVNIKKYIYTEF